MTVLTHLRTLMQRISLPRWRMKNTTVYLFFLMLFIAVFTFTEYGVAWDETLQRIIGFLALGYLLNPGAYGELYLNYRDVDYPVFFELILAGVELFYAATVSIFEYSGSSFDELKAHLVATIWNADEPENNSGYFRQAILIRHFTTHIFFLISALFAYRLVYFLYKNKTLAVIAFFLIVLHPRLYAHSFFNSKDIPFLSMFIISLYYTAVALKYKTSKNFIILGLCAGVLANIRIMGVMLPCLVSVFLLLDMLKEKSYWFYTKRLGILAFVFCITLYTSWPYLWSAPIENFVTAFNNMKNFDRTVFADLFNGRYVYTDNLPVSYIPVWFSITTPVIYLFFGFFGTILVILKFLKQPINLIYNPHQRFFLICLAVFLAPVMLVILFNSTLYNGWRHLYFIYAGFVFLIIYGIDFLIRKNKNTVYIPFIAFIFCSIYMIRAYPLQQTYFNALVPKTNEYISENFIIGYLKSSTKEALEYILKADNSQVIKVSAIPHNTTNPMKWNRQFLKSESERLVIVDRRVEVADYIIIYNYTKIDSDIGTPIHRIKRQNNTIITIYKLKNR